MVLILVPILILSLPFIHNFIIVHFGPFILFDTRIDKVISIFNGVTSPFISLLGFYLIYKTLYMQKVSLDIQKRVFYIDFYLKSIQKYKTQENHEKYLCLDYKVIEFYISSNNRSLSPIEVEILKNDYCDKVLNIFEDLEQLHSDRTTPRRIPLVGNVNLKPEDLYFIFFYLNFFIKKINEYNSYSENLSLIKSELELFEFDKLNEELKSAFLSILFNYKLKIKYVELIKNVKDYLEFNLTENTNYLYEKFNIKTYSFRYENENILKFKLKSLGLLDDHFNLNIELLTENICIIEAFYYNKIEIV